MKNFYRYFTVFTCAVAFNVSATADEVPPMHDLARQRMRAIPMLPDVVQNPGFEAISPATELPDWSGVMHGGDSYRVAPDASQAYAGKQSLIIENIGKPSWGGAVQSIRAERLAGREIELSAQIKTQGVTAPGFHIAMKSTQTGRELEYVQTDAALIGDADWKILRLRTRLPMETNKLELRLILDGDGRVWVDEVRLKPVPQEEKQK